MNGTSDVYRCTCQGPWGIGLPFDHPIWESIMRSCPEHGHLLPPVAGKSFTLIRTNTTNDVQLTEIS